jgi:hypothetical protein
VTEGPQRDPLRLTAAGFTTPQPRVVKGGNLRRHADEELTTMAGRGHAGAQKELKRRYGDKTPDEYWSRTPGQDPVDVTERAIRAWESSPPHKR